jgi:integrase/recombinase XerD
MNGGDVMSLKRILGHTTLDVTQTYIRLAEAHVKVQHQRFSPVDRLGLGRGRRRQR